MSSTSGLGNDLEVRVDSSNDPVPYPPLRAPSNATFLQRHAVLIGVTGGVLALVLLLTLLPRALVPGQPAIGVETGMYAPDFTRSDVQGHPVTLRSYRGRNVMVLFWAVDCGYCQDELKDLQRAMRSLPHPPTLLAVDVWNEPRDYVADYVRSAGMPGTVLFDPHPKHTAANLLYGPYKGFEVPSAVYIDSKGLVSQHVTGQESFDDFQTYFQQLAQS